jgi:aspartate beta-hydroxylase
MSPARERFHRFVDAYVESDAPAAATVYPGLSAEPWYAATRFPVTAALEGACAAIRAELAALPAQRFHREAEPLPRDGSWDVVMLYERGRRDIENCRALPTLAAILEGYPTLRTLAGLCYVSRLRPGTHVAPHRGPTNLRVRCHLGLSVPKGDCALRAGGETRRWVEGKCFVFNDFLEHEAWNRTGSDRIVLVVDLWHPDLDAEEVHLLARFQQRILAQAGNLARYWADNDRARAAEA